MTRTLAVILALLATPLLAQGAAEGPAKAPVADSPGPEPQGAEAGADIGPPAPEQTAPEQTAAEQTAAEQVAEALKQPNPAEIAAARASGTYAFDPDHAQAVFSYDHLGFSTSFGLVNGITGTVTLDPADPSKSTVTARFPISAIRTISPELDRQLLSADFLAAVEGEVSFVSTRVETTGGTTATVTGDLTLNGVSRPVVLDMVLNQAGLNPVEQKPSVGFSGTTTIRRSDFGLGKFAPAVGDEVQIRLNVEAMRG